MEKIWLHGYSCDCPQCEDDDETGRRMVYDIGGEDLRSVEFPAQIGDGRLLIDQHGNVYDIRYTGWMQPSD